MSQFYAAFSSSPSGIQERQDTRVYFHHSPAQTQATGKCKGVVWMCNPGSATGASTAWGPLRSDPTLNAVLRLYQDAVKAAVKVPSPNDYIAILNCFYTCNPDVGVAFQQWLTLLKPHSESIDPAAAFVIAAWGTDKPYGLVCKSMNEISRRKIPVFFHDPTSAPATLVSTSFERAWFQAHPLSSSFSANSLALASAIGPFL